jgi:UDP-3-O-[3-hydroxymyristoyl] glucosamine N-acyltransferase
MTALSVAVEVDSIAERGCVDTPSVGGDLIIATHSVIGDSYRVADNIGRAEYADRKGVITADSMIKKRARISNEASLPWIER